MQPMDSLTPRQIVTELDKYIVGQADAKRAVAVAIRNRWRRQQLPEAIKKDVSPKNILMIGPTGVGKTEIARRLATLVSAPFIKVEATKYTEIGYHGRDVDAIIRDLVDSAIHMVRTEMAEKVKDQAQKAAEDRLLDKLLPAVGPSEPDAQQKRSREKLRQRLRAGKLEKQEIEVAIEERAAAVGVLGPGGMELDVDFQSMIEKLIPTRQSTRRLSVADARRVLLAQEQDAMLDKEKIQREAIGRVEQSGIVFLDEIDKICGPDSKNGPDVSRQGVQRDLLPIVEGSTVVTRYGPVKTDYILFIAAGAFHISKPGDLMPELQGRFPIRVELQDLTKDDFVRILREPQNSLTRQQSALLAAEGLDVTFAEDAIDAMAQLAYDLNRKTQNIGARRLYTIMERVFEEISFAGPHATEKKVEITAEYVRKRLADVMKDEDLAKFIL
ncbi:MAG: ATP-dependent protease ATPase subunit HslU [Tepidisphaeraceae bacterium]